MARRPSSGQAQGSKSKASSPREKSAQRGRKPVSSAADSKDRDHVLIDDRARRDIAGVALIILGIALFVCAAFPSSAMVTATLSNGMHLVFGLGAYILPLFMIVVGASFLVRFGRQRVPTRASIGLLLIFFALLVLLSLFTPGATDGAADVVFNVEAVTGLGGIIGAGVAWVGLTFLGQVVSCILMLGVIIIGAVIIGLSISGIIEQMRSAYNGQGAEDGVAPFARIRRAKQDQLPFEEQPEEGFRPALNAPNTQMMQGKAPLQRNSGKNSQQKEKKSGLLSRANTALLPFVGGEGDGGAAGEGSPSQPLGASAPLSAKPTQALSGRKTISLSDDAPAKQMTRKLGKANAPAADAGEPTVSPKTKAAAAAVSTPRPDDGFQLPPMNLLASTQSKSSGGKISDDELAETAQILAQTLEDFGITVTVAGWVAGPTVTLFKVSLPAGVRVSRITALNDDIALALAAPGVRIFAPIPGTNYVGIEIPNKQRQTVYLGDVLKNATGGPLEVAIGEDVEGNRIVSDLAKMPHLLIGGTTGSGKSVSINAMIMSILMRATPSEVRFIMIDPKRVEFTPYNGIPHLYVPVVTEAKEAASALSWGVAEMERRLKVFSKVGVRNIGQYNAKVQSGELEKEGEETPLELPYIVIIIDELADLMMNVGKEVEFSISRIAQLARAAGIHLIVATQRPSANVVTGLIKANITNRISFNVASSIDSRVILDTPGAENLIGNGDLLLSKPEFAKPQRIQGCYVSEPEIHAVVQCLKEQGEPEYHGEILKTNLVTLGDSSPDASGGGSTSDDPLIWEAADIVVTSGLGSTSNLQRRLKVGYARAGRIMDMLEEKGIVGPANGSKPREVLVDVMELETLKAFEANDE